MQNIEVAMEGDTLILKIDTKKNFGPSKKGNSIMVASSGGFQSVPGAPADKGLTFNLNVCLPISRPK